MAEPTYNVLVPPATVVPLTTLNALDEPRIISKSAALPIPFNKTMSIPVAANAHHNCPTA
ncbi:MAG: hypothetical protein AABY38_02030 [Planctomycetota bacterium]